MNKIFNFLTTPRTILTCICLVFFVLLLRNPYSTRTLIPNLEPFPDAFYYTTPPRCFLHGQGFRMCRLYNPDITGITSAVPPAYSITLLTGYLLNFDVRTFYFINVVLSFFSALILFKICQNFFKNQFISGFILFLYVTNYFIYWYPTLAMAENLLLPLFLLSILVLQQKKLTFKLSILAGLLAISFYATKYAFAPLTLTFPLFYFIKILKTKQTNKQKIAHFLLLTIPATIIMANLVGVQVILGFLNEFLNGAIDTNSNSTITSGKGFFSVSYFSKHIREYSLALVGKSQRFLWDNTPLTERWIALPGLLGLLLSFRLKKLTLAKFWLNIAVITQLLFISTFYVVDVRYVYHFLPTLLLGFGFFLQHLHKTIFKNNINFLTLLFVLLSIYLATNVLRLKSVVMVNLKYSESPWWYLSQLEMNRYFDSFEETTKKPILITLASPYLTDNYSNQKYTVLPLNDQQDFKGSVNKVWGQNNYTNLLLLYQQKVLEGNDVFLTNYGVSAANHFKESYLEIQNKFKLIEVHSGCYNLCNIYKLEFPND